MPRCGKASDLEIVDLSILSTIITKIDGRSVMYDGSPTDVYDTPDTFGGFKWVLEPGLVYSMEKSTVLELLVLILQAYLPHPQLGRKLLGQKIPGVSSPSCTYNHCI